MVALLVAICVVALMAGVGGPAASAVPPPASAYVFTAGQTSNLTDGSLIPLLVTSSDPSKRPVGYVTVLLCRPGPDYNHFRPLNQANVPGNCGFSPGSSALSSPNGNSGQQFAGEPSGASSFPDNFVAGVGQNTYLGSTLTCDSANPCDLVVSVFKNPQTTYLGPTAVHTFQLTFLPFGQITGCNGVAADAVQTVGTDRLVQSYPLWSQQACGGAGPGGGQAPTQNVFLDEGGPGGAVDNFANRNADMAYAASGYGLPGFSEPSGRPYVAVPLALNAVVVAASGGQFAPAYTPRGSLPVLQAVPYTSLQVTAGEAASLFGGGYLTAAQDSALRTQNKALASAGLLVPYTAGTTTVSFIYPQVRSGVDATTVFDTTYLTDVAGEYWNSGPHQPAGQPKYVPRGVISSFAQPGSEQLFTSAGTYSHRTDLERATLPWLGIGGDPLWILTDRATATQLRLPISDLGNDASGTFTAPTTATMDGAVTSMTAQPDQTLIPNSLLAEATGAYPLTFVEYALVPTEPLVDATCTPRATSQQLMVQWLHFLLGPGQTNLAPGLEPLTPGLQQVATAALAKVGTAAQTGACAPAAPASPTTTVAATKPAAAAPVTTASTTSTTVATPTAGLAGLGPIAGSSSFAFTSNAQPVPTGSAVASVSANAPAQDSLGPSVAHPKMVVAFPPFAGRATAGAALPAIALVLLGLLTGATAWRTSGRSPRGALGKLGRPLRGWRRAGGRR